MRDKKRLIEAALFIAARPMTLAELYHIVGIPKPQIKSVIEEMMTEYDEHGLIVREFDDKYELQVKDDLRVHVKHLAPDKDFSKATLQTLSLIAYHNPVKQSLIIETRGNRAYDHIKELSGRGFIKLVPEGHTNRIHITKKFLDYFGLTSNADLKSYFSGQGIDMPEKDDTDDDAPITAEEPSEETAPVVEPAAPPMRKSVVSDIKPVIRKIERREYTPEDFKMDDEEPEKPKKKKSKKEEPKKNIEKNKYGTAKKPVSSDESSYVSPFADVINKDKGSEEKDSE